MPTLTATAAYSTALDGAWTEDTSIRVDNVVFRCAPGIPTAVLTRYYGWMHNTGDGTRGQVTPLDLRGKFIRIRLYDGTSEKYWYGYCPALADAVDKTTINPDTGGGSIPTGRTTYTCYGMEWWLQQAVIDRSLTEAGTVLRALPYNSTARIRHIRIAGNRSAAPAGDGVYNFDTDGTDQWGAVDAAQNLLKLFNSAFGIQYTLAGQITELADVAEVWQTEGRTFYDVLTSLINPARGYTFYVVDRTIHVVSISDQAIGDYIPANSNVVALTIDQSRAMERPTLRHIDNAHYDIIDVRGAPLRVMFTASWSRGNLVKDWTDAEETAYNAASDADRRKEQYEHVYTRYRIPADWDGKLLTLSVLPGIDTDTGQPKTGQAEGDMQIYWVRDMLLDRTIYYPGDNQDDVRAPLILVRDSDLNYQRVDNNEDYSNCPVYCLDGKPGFMIRPPYPHYYGLNHFSGDSDDGAALDWTEIIATISLRTDEHARVVVNAVTPEAGPVTRRKLISVPDAEVWWISADTVTDFSGAALTTQSAEALVRDDSGILRQVADLARVWYGRQRTAISVAYRQPTILDRLGQVIRETYAGGTVTPAGTVITRIAYNLPQQTMNFETEWFDIDLARAVNGPRGGGAFGRRFSSELSNIPARVGASAAAASSSVVWEITAAVDGDGLVGAKQVNLDGSLAGSEVKFELIAE